MYHCVTNSHPSLALSHSAVTLHNVRCRKLQRLVHQQSNATSVPKTMHARAIASYCRWNKIMDVAWRISSLFHPSISEHKEACRVFKKTCWLISPKCRHPWYSNTCAPISFGHVVQRFQIGMRMHSGVVSTILHPRRPHEIPGSKSYDTCLVLVGTDKLWLIFRLRVFILQLWKTRLVRSTRHTADQWEKPPKASLGCL